MLPVHLTCIALLLACGTAGAAEPRGKAGAAGGTELPPVEVTTLRDPVEKSYRKIASGMDLFEQRRSLAPNATLRFKLLPRSRATDMRGVTVEIIGNTVVIPVSLAQDGTFTLPLDQRALSEDAMVIPNRKAGSMTWRADIRTPGLPPDTRRLGDLRLECEVGMEADLVSNLRSWFGRIDNPRLRRQGWCERPHVNYFFFAERPLFGVTLVSGRRREVLPVDRMYAGISRYPDLRDDLAYCDCQVLLDRAYYLPLGDKSWPDDTRVELEYMDAAETGGRTKSEVTAAHGAAQVIRFDSGYEVWVYRLAGERGTRNEERGRRNVGEDATGEFVVLFAPSGVATRTRLRPAQKPKAA